MFCPKCGNKLNDGAKFCNNCGLNVGSTNNDAGNTTENANTGANYSQTANSSNQYNSSINENPAFDNNMPVEYPSQTGTNYQGNNSINTPKQGNMSDAPKSGTVEMPSHSESSPKKKSGAKTVFISVLITVFVAALGFAGWKLWLEDVFFGDEDSKSVSSSKDNESDEADAKSDSSEVDDAVVSDAQEEAVDSASDLAVVSAADEEVSSDVVDFDEAVAFESVIDELISSYGVSGDVAVAVFDNNSEDIFFSDGYDKQFVAWGLYAPVYLALELKYPNSYDSYKNDIMSSDPGKCNAAANFAIDCFGGTEGLNKYLNDALGLYDTSYGRKFGDVNASGENYSTVADAGAVMWYMNDFGIDDKLCYSSSSFGITAPYGSVMHAQIGTENRSVRKELNLYAVIEGYTSNYSIAIMTKNNASSTGIIDALLSLVHTHMEG